MISTIAKPLSADCVLLRKPACMRVAFSATAGILSALVPLLVKETSFLLLEYRDASERQESRSQVYMPRRDLSGA